MYVLLPEPSSISLVPFLKKGLFILCQTFVRNYWFPFLSILDWASPFSPFVLILYQPLSSSLNCLLIKPSLLTQVERHCPFSEHMNFLVCMTHLPFNHLILPCDIYSIVYLAFFFFNAPFPFFSPIFLVQFILHTASVCFFQMSLSYLKPIAQPTRSKFLPWLMKTTWLFFQVS